MLPIPAIIDNTVYELYQGTRYFGTEAWLQLVNGRALLLWLCTHSTGLNIKMHMLKEPS